MKRPNPLHVVEPVAEAPDLYTEHRKHILSRDWSAVHVSADKRSPFATVLGRFR